jgi:hypothetical protein
MIQALNKPQEGKGQVDLDYVPRLKPIEAGFCVSFFGSELLIDNVSDAVIQGRRPIRLGKLLAEWEIIVSGDHRLALVRQNARTPQMIHCQVTSRARWSGE